MFENGFRTITDYVIHLWSWNFIHLLPMSQGCAYWFWGQKVKGQGHGLSMFENGFRTITDYVIHLWSWNFIHLLPMSQGCALLILGSKGQRSRSWIIDVWKWFPDHNWLCNPPMIMKLHTLAPHESRMFNSCLYKGFLQLGFLHLWCTLYLLTDPRIWTSVQWSETFVGRFERFAQPAGYLYFQVLWRWKNKCGREGIFQNNENSSETDNKTHT